MSVADHWDWVRYALALALVVCNVGVWRGVALEENEISWGAKEAGKSLLIKSLALEALFAALLFVVDTKIALDQKLEIATLENKLAARDLTSDQLKQIADALHPFGPIKFELATYWTVDEPKNLANKIADAAIAAGWDKSSLMDFPMTVVAGVLVTVKKVATDKQQSAAGDALVSALNKAGIAAARGPDENINIGNNKIEIAIMVGLKP